MDGWMDGCQSTLHFLKAFLRGRNGLFLFFSELHKQTHSTESGISIIFYDKLPVPHLISSQKWFKDY